VTHPEPPLAKRVRRFRASDGDQTINAWEQSNLTVCQLVDLGT